MAKNRDIQDLLLLAASLPDGAPALPDGSPQAVLSRRLYEYAQYLLDQTDDPDDGSLSPALPDSRVVAFRDQRLVWGTGN